jgi:hypothetical protein
MYPDLHVDLRNPTSCSISHLLLPFQSTHMPRSQALNYFHFHPSPKLPLHLIPPPRRPSPALPSPTRRERRVLLYRLQLHSTRDRRVMGVILPPHLLSRIICLLILLRIYLRLLTKANIRPGILRLWVLIRTLLLRGHVICSLLLLRVLLALIA